MNEGGTLVWVALLTLLAGFLAALITDQFKSSAITVLKIIGGLLAAALVIAAYILLVSSFMRPT